MDRQKELEIVTTAYYLEDNIAKLTTEQRQLQMQMPTKPVEPKLLEPAFTPTPYPDIDLSSIQVPKIYKILKLVGVILLPFGLLGGIILLVAAFSLEKSKKQELESQYTQQVKSSSEYQNACRQIDEQNRIEQSRMAEEAKASFERDIENYNIALKEHNDYLLPQWKKEYDALETALNDAKSSLTELYNRNIIPAQYHNIPALLYIATFLSSSEYDLKYAIERWDTNVMQRAMLKNNDQNAAIMEIMAEIRTNQQYSNWLSEQMIAITNQGNETLQSINNWQKADIAVRTYERIKERRNAKR